MKSSPQVIWQEKRKAEGKCTICGKEPLASGSESRGLKCLAKMAQSRRKVLELKAWRPGGRGRIPLHAKNVENF